MQDGQKEPNQEGRYLINTAKAVKGSKLKTKDFIKMQLMRFRKCSPLKYQQSLDHQTESLQFKKYRPFEIIQQEGIQRIVADQRVKMSRQTKGRMKLFNNTKINFLVEEEVSSRPAGISRTAGVSSRTASHHYRQQKKLYGKNKTHQSLASREEGRQKKAPLFRSDNLGIKMNNYLNTFIYKDGQSSRVDPKRGQTQHISGDLQEEKHSQTIDVFRSKRNVAFLRKMKRNHKSRADSVGQDFLTQHRSQQLVKPTTSAVSKREHMAMPYNRIH